LGGAPPHGFPWDTARARGVLRRVLIFRPRGGEKVQPD